MYSDEEKNAIKDLKSYLNWIETNNFEKLPRDRNIETVLNLIEKQSKLIEQLKTKNNDLLRKLRNRVKEVKKLQKYSLYKNEFTNLNKRIEKQDKIINEMIEYINSNVILYPECDVGCEKDNNCITCILKYFEEKVRENKQDGKSN